MHVEFEILILGSGVDILYNRNNISEIEIEQVMEV